MESMSRMDRWRRLATFTAVVFAVVAGTWLLLSVREPDTWTPVVEDVAVGERQGALLDQVVFRLEQDPGRIPDLIEGGSIQLYAQGISNATVFRRIRDSLRIDYDIGFGSSAELTLNPAGPTFNDGRLNPLHVREIREALNWLVDRRYVAEELFSGLAVPRFLPINTVFPDYARLAEVARTLELRYRHDPERARRIIEEQLEHLGAERVGGLWMHDGAPIRFSILIGSTGGGRRIGDYVSNLLEGLGFRVERLYRAADEASRIWLAGDPHEGRWHISVGGWSSVIVNRDLAGNLNFYYTARGRPEPLWQVYAPDPELDYIAERLMRRDYTTWDERQQMMARGLELAMEDSVRIWLTDQISILARDRNVSVAADLAGGIVSSELWPFTLRYRDRVGGTAVVGLSNLLTEPWNPVAGSNWVFDRMMMRGLSDSPLLPDPFTGLFWPQRIDFAEVTVREDVPVIRSHDWLTVERVPEITVPSDAWIDWDVEAGRWITAAEQYPDGLTARTRVRVQYERDFLRRRWHDGSQFSLADVILPWILEFERADQASSLYDAAAAPGIDVFKRHFRGRRILSTDPLVIEIFSDQIYPDAEWIASARTPELIAPWHTLAVAIRAEIHGELAFSSHKADRSQIDWMSLVAGPSLAILERHLGIARERGHLPFEQVLGDYVRPGEVAERYAAMTDWYAARRHFWIDNGPYYLHSVHTVERSVVLRRFEGFPDRADRWLRFSKPQIPAVDVDGPMLVALGGAPEFEIEISFDGEPYPRDAIERARYLLFDSRGRLVAEGDAVASDNGRWSVSLTPEAVAQLGIGASSLEVAVTSELVALPAFASHVFAVVPSTRRHARSDRTGGLAAQQ
jgi:peptide/nickel transport system substrate-binding protein